MIVIYGIVLLIVFCLFSLFVPSRRLDRVKNNKTSPGYLYIPIRGKYGLVGRYIGVECDSALTLMIRRERFYDRFLKRQGLASEIQVDQALDDTIYVMADDATSWAQFLHKPEITAALKTLFIDYKIKYLSVQKDKIFLYTGEDKGGNDKIADILKDIVQRLKTVVAQPDFSLGVERMRSLRRLAVGAMLFHASVLTTAIASALLIYRDHYQLLGGPTWMGWGVIGMVGVLGWGTFLLGHFKGSSWIGYVLADFVLFGAIGVGLSCYILLRGADMQLDTKEPLRAETKVTMASCKIHCSKSCGRKCTKTSNYQYSWQQCNSASKRQQVLISVRQKDYICANFANYSNLTIFTDSLMYHGEEIAPAIKVDVDEVRFDRIIPGKLLKLPVHQGFLNWKWVDDKEIGLP